MKLLYLCWGSIAGEKWPFAVGIIGGARWLFRWNGGTKNFVTAKKLSPEDEAGWKKSRMLNEHAELYLRTIPESCRPEL